MRIFPVIKEIPSANQWKFGQVSLDECHESIDPSLRGPLGHYLLESTFLVTVGNVVDPLAPEKGPIVPMGMSTDGEWAWPTYWSYFVREYGFSIPEEFIEHARRREFVPAELSLDEAQVAQAEIQQILDGQPER
ncbi:hypothetical protein [Streptomyces sp. G45]|uniref:hypothetical protein n=1 Tax=Streptomyces sp. G45 TaxID=3406627 RepID=UPI003C2346C5